MSLKGSAAAATRPTHHATSPPHHCAAREIFGATWVRRCPLAHAWHFQAAAKEEDKEEEDKEEEDKDKEKEEEDREGGEEERGGGSVQCFACRAVKATHVSLPSPPAPSDGDQQHTPASTHAIHGAKSWTFCSVSLYCSAKKAQSWMANAKPQMTPTIYTPSMASASWPSMGVASVALDSKE